MGQIIDAVETAGRLGISADRAQNYHADSEGVAVATFRECAAMPKGWSDEG